MDTIVLQEHEREQQEDTEEDNLTERGRSEEDDEMASFLDVLSVSRHELEPEEDEHINSATSTSTPIYGEEHNDRQGSDGRQNDNQLLDRPPSLHERDSFSPSVGVFHTHTLYFTLPSPSDMHRRSSAGQNVTASSGAISGPSLALATAY